MKLLFLLASLLASSMALADSSLSSPDHQLVAVVQELRNQEIYVSLQNRQGKELATINFQSQDAEHGRTLGKSHWSADSKFFVFTTESSGGHSPWHDQAYFFSRESETFRSIDNRSGLSVAALDFTIDANDVLHFMKWDFDRQLPVAATLRLSTLDRQRGL